MTKDHATGPARPQAASGVDRAGGRAGGDVRHRDAGPHRHAEPHVRHADRHRLPAHQLPDPRHGGVQQRHRGRRERHRRPQADPGVAGRGGSPPARASHMRTDPSPVTHSSCPDGNAIGGAGSALGFSFDPNRQLSSVRLVQGRAPSAADDVVMDRGTATKYHFRVGDRVRVLSGGPPRASPSPASSPSAPPTTWQERRLPALICRRHRPCSTRAGDYDTINILAEPGVDNVRASAGDRPDPPAGCAGGQRSDGRQRALQCRQQRAFVPFDGAAGVRADLAVRRRASPSSTRSRSRSGSEPASWRCSGWSEPAAVRCSGRCWARPRRGTRRLPDRSWAGRAGRARAKGAAGSVRRDAALSAARVRGPYGRARARGWHRGHRDLGDRSGSARRADRPRRRARGDGRRAGGVVATAGHHRRCRGDRRDRRPGGGVDRTGDRTGRARRDGRVHRRRPAGTDRRAADVERARPPAGRAARRAGEDGTRELDAQPTTDRPDRRRPDGRHRARVGDRRPRRLAVAIGEDQPRKRRHRRRHHHRPEFGFSTSIGAAVSRIPGVSTVTNVYKGQFELRGSLSSLAAVTRLACGGPSTWRSPLGAALAPWRLASS